MFLKWEHSLISEHFWLLLTLSHILNSSHNLFDGFTSVSPYGLILLNLLVQVLCIVLFSYHLFSLFWDLISLLRFNYHYNEMIPKSLSLTLTSLPTSSISWLSEAVLNLNILTATQIQQVQNQIHIFPTKPVPPSDFPLSILSTINLLVFPTWNFEAVLDSHHSHLRQILAAPIATVLIQCILLF